MPKPNAKSRRAQAEQEEPRLSRLDEMRRQRRNPRFMPPMPPSPLPHLFGWLAEMGITQAAGMGVAPLSWGEIDAWCRRTCIDLEPWESRLIRRLSSEYVAESRRAESENCPAPWKATVTPAMAATEVADLRAVLG